MRTSVLNTGLAVALVVGIAACKGPESLDTNTDSYAGVARAANVLPTAPTDTSGRGSATFSTATGAYTWAVSTPMVGTVDTVALIQVGAAAAVVAASNITAMFCNSAATCGASGSGTATTAAGAALSAANLAAIKTSARGYGTQLVFITTTGTKAAGGAARGAMFANP